MNSHSALQKLIKFNATMGGPSQPNEYFQGSWDAAIAFALSRALGDTYTISIWDDVERKNRHYNMRGEQS